MLSYDNNKITNISTQILTKIIYDIINLTQVFKTGYKWLAGLRLEIQQ